MTSKVHIRIKKRTNRTYITTVEGIPPKIDKKKVLRHIKKTYSCNGSILNKNIDGSEVEILQFSGDQRAGVSLFLIAEGIASNRNIITHGF